MVSAGDIISKVTVTYLVSANMPGIGNALKAIKVTVGASVPLFVAGIAIFIVIAGTLGPSSVDLVFRP